MGQQSVADKDYPAGTCAAELGDVRTPQAAVRAERSSSIPTAKELFFAQPTLDPDSWAERENAFFRSLRLRNGTFKTTYPHRLDSVNEIVNTLLPAERPLEMMDAAASSGVATLEWIDSLRRAGIAFRMTAGDLCVRAFLLSLGPFLNVLVDKTGYPLQFDILGTAFPYPPRRRLAVLFPPLFVAVHMLRWVLPALFTIAFKRLPRDAEGTFIRRVGIDNRPTFLISPRLAQGESLTIVEDDLLATGPFDRQFHVIRAANVLNNSYFSEERLRIMIANLRARLKTGGMLIVCRTHDDGVNHGTLFLLNTAGEFEVARRIGDGSEIESLVLRPSGASVGPMEAAHA